MEENNEILETLEEEVTIIDKNTDEANALKEANDKYLRVLAEFENYRKRTEREKTSFFDNGARDVLAKILPTLDSFERALASEDGEKFKDGVEMIYKNLKTTLESLGLAEIAANGTQFNTNLHQAVMHVEDETLDANIVVEELQKGYTFKDKPLRFSMVKVAN